MVQHPASRASGQGEALSGADTEHNQVIGETRRKGKHTRNILTKTRIRVATGLTHEITLYSFAPAARNTLTHDSSPNCNAQYNAVLPCLSFAFTFAFADSKSFTIDIEP